MGASVLWTPSPERVRQSQMAKFLYRVEEKFHLSLPDYSALHHWSVEQGASFWKELFSFFPIRYQGSLDPACTDWGFETYGWFPRVQLNFAENLLIHGSPEALAINALHESGLKRQLTYRELSSLVGKLTRSLKRCLHKGEVLACFMPNIPETVVSFLATSSLGATFTSTSCDFGLSALEERFSQCSPRVLVAACGYEYKGRYFDNLPTIIKLCRKMANLRKVILVDFLSRRPDISGVEKGQWWEDFLDHGEGDIPFESNDFSHPLVISYSSGTTGKPKCIVHTQGGVLLQHIKELGLHTDITSDDNLFYFTTCGWMMWNWAVSALFFGSTVTLYEGSPIHPSLDHYQSLIDRENISVFGTSPKFLRSLQQEGATPSNHFKSLRMLLSTGAVLNPEQFDYVYNHIKSDIHLASISGGTDILGCFVLGNPILPVRRGEIQSLGLGMAVDSFDVGGRCLRNKKGELVCKKSFPSRPLGFLNDHGGNRFYESYLRRYKNVWHHGDFIAISEEGSSRIYGRSDATLNPGGVRIGTAEIYRQVEKLPFVDDSLSVGKTREGQQEVYLFVKMVKGEKFDSVREHEIKELLKKNLGPRYVPRRILPVRDIPYTRNGKKMELSVTRIMEGKDPSGIESMVNPECLDEYAKSQKESKNGG